MSQKNDQLNFTLEEKEQLRQIVLARISVMPDSVNISVGSSEMNKDQLIKHIKSGDEVGEQMISMELQFLQDMASGAAYNE